MSALHNSGRARFTVRGANCSMLWPTRTLKLQERQAQETVRPCLWRVSHHQTDMHTPPITTTTKAWPKTHNSTPRPEEDHDNSPPV